MMVNTAYQHQSNNYSRLLNMSNGQHLIEWKTKPVNGNAQRDVRHIWERPLPCLDCHRKLEKMRDKVPTVKYHWIGENLMNATDTNLKTEIRFSCFHPVRQPKKDCLFVGIWIGWVTIGHQALRHLLWICDHVREKAKLLSSNVQFWTQVENTRGKQTQKEVKLESFYFFFLPKSVSFHSLQTFLCWNFASIIKLTLGWLH